VLAFFRLTLARTLTHPLEGLTFQEWIGLLRRERFRVDPACWPKALWVTAQSVWNSFAAGRVERTLGDAVRATRVEAPVFILGHYRSGTTYLHELMACDARYASPNRFQAYNPRTFPGTERWLAPVVEPFMLPRRVQEDEIALMNLTRLSPYMDWCFPRSGSGYGRYLTFRDAGPDEVAAWSDALAWFLRALTRDAGGRPLVLKSPPHTARVALILRIFPDARFVHIRRDPYAVFVSTVGLLKAIPPVFRLQRGPKGVDTGAVLATYAAMYDAYFDDAAGVPPGQLVEVAYEELERDPIGRLRGVYDGLALGDFEEVRPALEAYLASNAGYRKNRHPELDGVTRGRVAEACARSFDAWGYAR